MLPVMPHLGPDLGLSSSRRSRFALFPSLLCFSPGFLSLDVGSAAPPQSKSQGGCSFFLGVTWQQFSMKGEGKSGGPCTPETMESQSLSLHDVLRFLFLNKRFCSGQTIMKRLE